ncbi:carbon-nitrogen hydrolase family protein [Winogradskyella aurantiaca]|uniref:carbon-nitrogen hydrolase family protein n=1 Tax=Winogradskyella aurantiaca TaxID=2219558 RepID=UPI000E1D0271|nr:carbon-nitrogen hydrolase family protein [Winogradskyella aurantiaca]
MKLAIAQILPLKGAIEDNIQAHKSWILKAVNAKADLIVFPELSLTGYEPSLAQDLAMTPEDSRLAVLQRLSDLHHISIAVGAPVRAYNSIHISMLIYQPNKALKVYHKQYLHEDETPFFDSGKQQLLFNCANEIIAPAICYEVLQPDHSKSASTMGATLYLASVAKPQDGVDAAYNHFPIIACEYGMSVIMSNSIGTCGNFMSAGQSGVWDSKGVLVSHLNTDEEGLLLFDTENRDIKK